MSDETIMVSKYSIVPKFWTTPTEITVDKYVASYDKTGSVYLNFIDSDGRLWKGKIDDFIIIKNIPDKLDIEDFNRLKQEADQMEIELKQKIKSEKYLNDVN